MALTGHRAHGDQGTAGHVAQGQSRVEPREARTGSQYGARNVREKAVVHTRAYFSTTNTAQRDYLRLCLLLCHRLCDCVVFVLCVCD